MKNTSRTILTILFATLVLLSCSSDDDSNSNMQQPNLIFGTWQPVRFEIDCFPDSNSGDPIVDEHSDCIKQSRLIFSVGSGGTETSNSGSYVSTRYNTDLSNQNCLSLEDSGNFTISDSMLTLFINGAESNQQIFLLNQNRLHIGIFGGSCNGGDPQSENYEVYERIN